MRLNEIHIRDPFILLDSGIYYLYGSRGDECWTHGLGFDVYTSSDGCDWQGPFPAFKADDALGVELTWAPEVHCYRGAYYAFVTLTRPGKCRATCILKAADPKGPFVLYADGITPADWECLDGTLYVEPNGTPYLVFCHEWLQVQDGQICAVQLSEDLKRPVSEPQILFTASSAPWADQAAETYITDGPQLYRTQNGALLMLWSSSAGGRYCEAVSISKSCEIYGPWQHESELFFADDGGHGMLFRTKTGALGFVCHKPNTPPFERPVIYGVKEQNGRLSVLDAVREAQIL